MMHQIDSIDTDGESVITAVFANGKTKTYDIIKMFSVCPQMKQLRDKRLFNRAKIDPGGYGISWTDKLDLSAETIWEEGTELTEPI